MNKPADVLHITTWKGYPMFQKNDKDIVNFIHDKEAEVAVGVKLILGSALLAIAEIIEKRAPKGVPGVHAAGALFYSVRTTNLRQLEKDKKGNLIYTE